MSAGHSAVWTLLWAPLQHRVTASDNSQASQAAVRSGQTPASPASLPSASHRHEGPPSHISHSLLF